MFRSSCPSCGAPVELKSSASRFVVCGFCKTSLAQSEGALKAIGRQGQLLEDYSPIQTGAAGRFAGQGLTVVGRLQVAYSRGAWNEWRLIFDDGSDGWLSDASGQYAILRDMATDASSGQGTGSKWPTFSQLTPGLGFEWAGEAWVVTDKRESEAIGAQGELPFAATAGSKILAVDARWEDRFLTLDYSDTQPRAYRGEAVALSDLKLSGLRSDVMILESAGRSKETLEALNCPNCGGSFNAVSGITVKAVCPHCRSELDLTEVQDEPSSARSGETPGVLDGGEASAQAGSLGSLQAPSDTRPRKTARLIRAANESFSMAPQTRLELGAQGRLLGADPGEAEYTVIGIISQSAVIEGEPLGWIEYLLFSPGRKLTWLIEQDGNWSMSRVLDQLPGPWGRTQVRLVERSNAKSFREDCRYESTVRWVAGSFNWQVKLGDRAEVTEYLTPAGSSGPLLIAERTAEAFGWTLSEPISAAYVERAFGLADRGPGPAAGSRSGASASALGSASGSAGSGMGWLIGAMVAHGLLLLSDFSFGGLVLTVLCYYLLKFIVDMDF